MPPGDHRLSLICWLICLCSSTDLAAQQWWQFRGANQGHITDCKPPIHWGGFLEEPKWNATIPGKGWSSPIVVGQYVWLTSSEEEALDESSVAERLAERPFDPKDYVAHRAVRLFAICIDASTGQNLKRIDLFERTSPEPIHWMNSYATPTPVSNGKIIVCHFGSLGTAAIDAESGKILWKNRFVVDEVTGAATSPVMWRDRIFLACDGSDEQYVVAVDTNHGQELWRTQRPEIVVSDPYKRRAFSTPILVESAGKTQLISMSAQWLISYDPTTGRQWWQARVGSGYSAVPTPCFDKDRVFVCTGYMTPELVAVSTLGEGDVTESAILWRYARQVPEIASPIIVSDEIYFASQRGILSCVNTQTGQMHWHERLEGSYTSSPIYAGGNLYFTNDHGVTTVIKPGKQFEMIARNELSGASYASFAPYQNRLIIRYGGNLAAVEQVGQD